MDRNAIAGFVTVSCSRAGPACAGAERPAERAVFLVVDEATYQALCPSCFRHSRVVRSGERAARAEVVELGWTVTRARSAGAPTCPDLPDRLPPR